VADDGITGGLAMPAELPLRPHLDHLRGEARDLLRAARAGDEGSLAKLARVPRLEAVAPPSGQPRSCSPTRSTPSRSTTASPAGRD